MVKQRKCKNQLGNVCYDNRQQAHFFSSYQKRQRAGCRGLNGLVWLAKCKHPFQPVSPSKISTQLLIFLPRRHILSIQYRRFLSPPACNVAIDKVVFKSTQGTVLNATASRDYACLHRAKEILA